MASVQPLYEQLKESLVADIARGALAPGDQIPSQRALGERHGMSHMTVRRALNELIADKVLTAIPGKGLFVAEPKAEAEAGRLVGFTEDMARRGWHASSRVVSAALVSASPILASGLGVSLGDPLVYLYRLRLVDGEPMALQSCFLPHARCPGLLEHDFAQQSLFAVLRTTYGLRLASSHAMVEAALATDQQAALLGMELPAPILVTEQITLLDDGTPIEFVRSQYRGDRYRLSLL
jgi:GntR family transcriptional regulator